jgi:hypothetical protein
MFCKRTLCVFYPLIASNSAKGLTGRKGTLGEPHSYTVWLQVQGHRRRTVMTLGTQSRQSSVGLCTGQGNAQGRYHRETLERRNMIEPVSQSQCRTEVTGNVSHKVSRGNRKVSHCSYLVPTGERTTCHIVKTSSTLCHYDVWTKCTGNISVFSTS